MFESFGIIFLSILFEAIPFVMIGAIASSLIEVFVTPSWLASKIPQRKWLGYIIAGLMGLIFPVCECAIVPIVRRLIKKGTPVGLALTFMLAVPIVNPVVLLSTNYAFNGMDAAIYRGLFGYIGAIIIGTLFDRYRRDDVVLKPLTKRRPVIKGVAKAPGVTSAQQQIQAKPLIRKEDILHIIRHTNSELYEVGRFLIMGAFISALLQTVVPRHLLLQFGNHSVLSILFMMALAFVLSLCSEADAFIASTFRYQFTSGSIVGFLIFGPMIDIKNTLMLAGVFKRRFVWRLIAAISAVCFVIALLFNLVMPGALM